MSYNEVDLIRPIVVGLFIILIIAQFYYRYIKASQIEDIIHNYYKDRGLKVVEISNLTIAEKLKYGVPLNAFIRLYGFIYTMFSQFGKNHFRKVETIDKEENEQIRYIDLYIRKRKLMSCNEFEVYNY